MRNLKYLNAFIIVLSIIYSTISCPTNCATCATDPTICDVCSPGYELTQSTGVCDINYLAQPEWPGVCTTGTRQSPINIITSSNTLCPQTAQFTQTINTVQTQIDPEGQSLKASYVDQSVVTYIRNGVTNTYNSLQFHWHHPSEHQIDSKYMDLELHVVHSNTDGSGNLAVTGLLFKVDKDMKNDIFDQYNFIPDNSSHPFLFPITMKNKLIYHYEGSLTTPPCSEIVSWFVYTEYFPITQRNFERILSVINSGRQNARQSQNYNGRQLEIFGGFCNQMNFN